MNFSIIKTKPCLWKEYICNAQMTKSNYEDNRIPNQLSHNLQEKVYKPYSIPKCQKSQQSTRPTQKKSKCIYEGKNRGIYKTLLITQKSKSHSQNHVFKVPTRELTFSMWAMNSKSTIKWRGNRPCSCRWKTFMIATTQQG